MQGQHRLVLPQQPEALWQLFSVLRTATYAGQCGIEATRVAASTADCLGRNFQQQRLCSTSTPQQAATACSGTAVRRATSPFTLNMHSISSLVQLQHRRRSNLFASTSHRWDRRFSANGCRSFASQPAFAYNDSSSSNVLKLKELSEAADVLPVILRQSAVLPMDPKRDLPPWDMSSTQRGYRNKQYKKEVLSTEKWTWSGSRSGVPFMGRSRFDPRTLHGPWMNEGASHADLDAHVNALAALPRTHLFLDAPDLPADTAAPFPAIEHSSPDEEPQPKRSRGRPKRDRALEAAEAAEQLAAAARLRAKVLAGSEILLAAQLRAAAEQQVSERQPEHPDDAPRRRLQNLSHTLPDVLRALRRAGLDADKPLEAALLRALSKTDLDAQPRSRREPSDKTTPALLITSDSAEAMATFLLKDVAIPGRQLRRLLQRSPWVLGLSLRQQVEPVVECLRHIVHLPDEKIARMVVRHPRTLVAQVDEHLLPLLDYMQTLGFTPRHVRRVFAACPVMMESFSAGLLRTSVAFWLGKGMGREDLAGFIAQYPKVTSLSQSTTQLKFDWLREHVEYGVEDHARNPILLSRSLSENLGPRILFALHNGFKVVRPTEKKSKKRRGAGVREVSAKEVTQIGFDRFLSLLGSTAEEYREFKERWDQELLPAWLAAHNCDLDYYTSMTWLEERGQCGGEEEGEEKVNTRRGRKQGSSSGSGGSSGCAD